MRFPKTQRLISPIRYTCPSMNRELGLGKGLGLVILIYAVDENNDISGT
jgi:hypothetical protein